MLRELGNNVRRYSRIALESTWSILKRIMSSPFTLIVLVAGLFYLFWPKMVEWFYDLTSGMQNVIEETIVPFASSVLDILSSTWGFVKNIITLVAPIVDWLTSPGNWFTKLVFYLVTWKFQLKKWIFQGMKLGGATTLDAFCAWLAGDTISMAFYTIKGYVLMFWNYLKKKGAVAWVLKVLKVLKKLPKMIFSIPATFLESIWNASKAFLKWLASKLTGGLVGGDQDVGRVADAFAAPWKKWWNMMKELFHDPEADPRNEVLTVDPVSINADTANETSMEVKKLSMTGMNGSKVLQKMDTASALMGWQGNKNMLDRIKGMDQLYQTNSKQVGEYDKFMRKVWDMAGKDRQMAQQVMT
jgi:hypothetical protein